MGKKREAFYVNGEDGERRKVKPDSHRFRGTSGEHRLNQDTYVNGNLFLAGWYPFVFWDVPIFDQHDNPITDNGVQSDGSGGIFPTSTYDDYTVQSPDAPSSDSGSGGGDGGSYNPDPSPSYTPDPTPSYDPSPSYDTGSSGGYDGGSSGGFDGGGGGGFDGGGSF